MISFEAHKGQKQEATRILLIQVIVSASIILQIFAYLAESFPLEFISNPASSELLSQPGLEFASNLVTFCPLALLYFL